MRKKILAFVFAAALLMALAVPLFGGGVYAGHDRGNGNSQDTNIAVCHKPGTPAEHTIFIDSVDLADHLGHGDVAGVCP